MARREKPVLPAHILCGGGPCHGMSRRAARGRFLRGCDLSTAVCSDCWWAWLIIWIQTMVGLVMDAVMIGIIFARISHPKYRGRTIAISDSAVISRRDGVLKFMFRIADFRRTQVGSVQIT